VSAAQIALYRALPKQEPQFSFGIRYMVHHGLLF
jgi:hypothetical protein